MRRACGYDREISRSSRSDRSSPLRRSSRDRNYSRLRQSPSRRYNRSPSKKHERSSPISHGRSSDTQRSRSPRSKGRRSPDKIPKSPRKFSNASSQSNEKELKAIASYLKKSSADLGRKPNLKVPEKQSISKTSLSFGLKLLANEKPKRDLSPEPKSKSEKYKSHVENQITGEKKVKSKLKVDPVHLLHRDVALKSSCIEKAHINKTLPLAVPECKPDHADIYVEQQESNDDSQRSSANASSYHRHDFRQMRGDNPRSILSSDYDGVPLPTTDDKSLYRHRSKRDKFDASPPSSERSDFSRNDNQKADGRYVDASDRAESLTADVDPPSISYSWVGEYLDDEEDNDTLKSSIHKYPIHVDNDSAKFGHERRRYKQYSPDTSVHFSDSHFKESGYADSLSSSSKYTMSGVKESRYAGSHLAELENPDLRMKESNFSDSYSNESKYTSVRMKDQIYTDPHLKQSSYADVHLQDSEYTDSQLKKSRFADSYTLESRYADSRWQESRSDDSHRQESRYADSHKQESRYADSLRDSRYTDSKLRKSRNDDSQWNESGYAGSQLESKYVDLHLKESRQTDTELRESRSANSRLKEPRYVGSKKDNDRYTDSYLGEARFSNLLPRESRNFDAKLKESRFDDSPSKESMYADPQLQKSRYADTALKEARFASSHSSELKYYKLPVKIKESVYDGTKLEESKYVNLKLKETRRDYSLGDEKMASDSQPSKFKLEFKDNRSEQSRCQKTLLELRNSREMNARKVLNNPSKIESKQDLSKSPSEMVPWYHQNDDKLLSQWNDRKNVSSRKRIESDDRDRPSRFQSDQQLTGHSSIVSHHLESDQRFVTNQTHVKQSDSYEKNLPAYQEKAYLKSGDINIGYKDKSTEEYSKKNSGYLNTTHETYFQIPPQNHPHERRRFSDRPSISQSADACYDRAKQNQSSRKRLSDSPDQLNFASPSEGNMLSHYQIDRTSESSYPSNSKKAVSDRSSKNSDAVRQFVPRQQNYHRPAEVLEDDNMELDSDIESDATYLESKSSSSSARLVQKKDTSSISDFEGAWRAATNTSIKLPTSASMFRVHSSVPPAVSSCLPQSSQGDKRISVMKNKSNDRQLRSEDKREVFYSQRDKPVSDSRFNNKEWSKDVSGTQRIVVPQPITKSDKLQFREGKKDDGIKTSISRKPESISENDKSVWEKHFVDWFSKQILPTQPFKLFMNKVSPNLSSANLAALPFDFLHHFESGDRYALNCLPTNHIEAQTLYSFVNQYRRLKLEGAGDKSFRRVEEKKLQIVQDETIYSMPSKIPDVSIPVLISETNPSKIKNLKQLEIQPIKSISNTSHKIPADHIVITCSNTTQGSLTSDSRKIVNQIPAATMSSSRSQQLPLSADKIAPYIALDEGNVTNLSTVSERVNPRWNAEVQQFIGRTKSANSRPIYLEYLEKTGAVPASNEAHKKPSKSDRRSRSPNVRSERKFPDDRRSRRRRTRSRSRSSNSSRSPLKTTKRKSPSPSRRRKISRSKEREFSDKGSSKVLDKKPKITTLKSAASSGKNESKPKLIVNLSTSQSSRKVVSADEIVQPEKTAYADEIIITSAKKKDSNLSLFINGKKRTVDMRKYKFDDEKLKSWDSQKSVKFKGILKNEAVKLINFHYDFCKYELRKIHLVLDKIRQSQKMTEMPMQQSVFCLKMLFDAFVNGGSQVSLKEKLDNRGNNWDETSYKTFKQFQDEVLKCCEVDLDKKVKFVDQKKRSVSEIEEKCELLYPQFSGDASSLIRLWSWKNQTQSLKFIPKNEISKETLEKWEKRSNKSDNKSWLKEIFRHPPFDSSGHRCAEVLSVLHSDRRFSKREAINEVAAWWSEGYYKWRYKEFEDLLKSEESQIPDLIVVDEDVDDKPDETKKSSSELRTDCPVVDIFADEDLPDLEEEALREYTEDASGAPTILLY